MPLGWKYDERATKEARRSKQLVSRLSRIDTKGNYHLRGIDMSVFRELVFQRANGRCEWIRDGYRCKNSITPETGEMHHHPGGYERHESAQTCFAICAECHRLEHNREVRLGTIPNVGATNVAK